MTEFAGNRQNAGFSDFKKAIDKRHELSPQR